MLDIAHYHILYQADESNIIWTYLNTNIHRMMMFTFDWCDVCYVSFFSFDYQFDLISPRPTLYKQGVHNTVVGIGKRGEGWREIEKERI